MKGPTLGGPRSRRWSLLALPALIGFVLASPCLRFAYLSDDFPFLVRAASFNPGQLVPDASSAFYRPISRELYFAFLSLLSPNNPLWGHIINALLLAGAVVLVTTFGRRLGGEKFGVLSGLFLASLGALPCLVAWVSCAQDLFAMVFIGAALNLELSRRRTLSIVCVVAALLSKETSLFFVPGLIFLRYLTTGNRREIVNAAIPYVGTLIVWGAAHHKIREFLLHGFATGAGGYVGIDNPFLLRNSLRTAGALVNLPPTGLTTPWTSELTLYLIAALLLLGVVFKVYRRSESEEGPSGLPDRSIVTIGVLLGVLPAVLTFASAKHWFPYYVCMPAIGTSLLLAVPLRRTSWRMSALALAAFMTLGVWFRGTYVGKITMPAEANFRALSDRLQRVDAQMRELHPAFPDSARIYLTVQTSMETGIHVHLMHGQVMRTWYLNKTLLALPAEFQDNTHWPKYLFWITPKWDVFEVTLPGLGVRTTGPQPDQLAYQKTLRSYAMGAWALGDVDRAVALLLNMEEPNELSWDFDRRLAAALLLASGREAEARGVLRNFTKPGRAQALDGVSAILTPELPRPGLDAAAFVVFGLKPNDAEAVRYLMFHFSDRTLLDKTRRMAERLLELRPGDPEALAMIDALDKVPEWEVVLVEPEGWRPPFQEGY